MIVTCPQCSKRYMLDEALIPKIGRAVKCFACQFTWEQMPLLSLDESHSIPTLPPLPKLGVEDTRPRDGKRPVLRRIFMVIFALVCLTAGVIVGRPWILEWIPYTGKFYEFLGFDTSSLGAGLTVINTQISRIFHEGQDAVVIKGDIVNNSDNVQLVPGLKVKVIGESGASSCKESFGKGKCVLDTWEHHLAEKSLLPGEQVHFETEPKSQLQQPIGVDVRF